MLREGFVRQLKAAFEPWLDFTPTLSQPSALTITVDYARYKVIGRTVLADIHLAIGSAGTATNNLSLGGLPFAPAYTGAERIVGTAVYFKSGTAFYTLAAIANSSTAVLFQRDGDTTWFTNTAANGDRIGIQLMYEF